MMLVLVGSAGCGGSAPPALPPSDPHALVGQIPPPQREASLDGKLVAAYPNIVDAQGVLRGIYRVTDLPRTFILDRSGRVRAVVKAKNEADVASVERAVDALIAEAP